MDKQDNKPQVKKFHKTAARREAKSDFRITDKAILGGYYNLARLNFFKTMMTILGQIEVDIKPIKEDNLSDYLRDILAKLNGNDDEVTKGHQTWLEDLKLGNEKLLLLQKLLYEHFPILGPIMASESSYKIYLLKNDKGKHFESSKVMRGVGLVQCLEVIWKIAQCLNDLRNFYTHYKPYNSVEDQRLQYRLQNTVAIWLEKVRDASRRIDKQRNKLSMREMEFLTSVDRYMSKSIEDEFGNIVPDKNGKAKKVSVEYPDYYFRIGTERDLVDAKGEIIENEAPLRALSDFGVVFFCILFLEKSQARLLQDELMLYENGPYDGRYPGDQAKNDILREMWSIYRIKVPRGKRLDPLDDSTQLAMDMINELRRCPMPLYDVLGKEGQRFFEDKISHPNEKTPEVYKRVRSTDRFPYLALRYIDLNRCFDDIRFHVQLGCFRFKFYEKTTIDGDVTVRSLQKEINGYGRLQDMERLRKEHYGDILQQSELVEAAEDISILNIIPDTTQTTPYITDSAASYNIHNNRIGMFWDDNTEPALLTGDEKCYLPELAVDSDGKAPVVMPAPRASISVYDLPALIFYQYLYEICKMDGIIMPSPEAIIKRKYNLLVKFFTDVSTGALGPVNSKEAINNVLAQYGMLFSEVPQKLIKYLTGDDDGKKNRLHTYALNVLVNRYNRISGQIDRLHDARKMVGNKQNKYGKKSFIDVSPRQLAEQLMKSIIEWQPSVDNGRNKLTGLNYQKMIAFLAAYTDEVRFSELEAIFRRANLLDGPGAHPFLCEVLKLAPENIEVFYELYLEKEKTKLGSYLSGNVDKEGIVITCLKEDVSTIPFLHSGRTRFQPTDGIYYRNLASRYLCVDGRRSTIMLPDGLFTAFILEAFSKKPFGDNIALQSHLQDKDLNNNAAYLISMYFEHVLHDHSQPFYLSNDSSDRFARCYELFAILQKQDGKNNELRPVPLTPIQITNTLTNRPQKVEKQIDIDIKKYALRSRKDRDAVIQRLKHKVGDVKKNERAIRRFKTQDMILFLMSKHILDQVLMEQNEDCATLFKLENVCAKGFLSQSFTAKFKIPITIKKDKNEKEVVDFYVVQENMSIKDYGVFYQLLDDERVKTLLAKIVEQRVVRFSALISELASYDHNRSRMFRSMQQFEQRAFNQHMDALTSLDHPDFMFKEVKNKKDRVGVRRNSFKHLLELLLDMDDAGLKPEDIEWLNKVRNAFCHNSYLMDMQQIEKTLPRIITQIVDRVELLSNHQ